MLSSLSSDPYFVRLSSKGFRTLKTVFVLGLLGFLADDAYGHAPPLYSAVAPIHAEKRTLYDASGRPVILAGVQMHGLEVFSPTDSSRALVDAMTSLTFRV